MEFKSPPLVASKLQIMIVGDGGSLPMTQAIDLFNETYGSLARVLPVPFGSMVHAGRRADLIIVTREARTLAENNFLEEVFGRRQKDGLIIGQR
jgi:hypothetical protein